MRYKNYILSKGDKVKLKTSGDNWLPSMTKKYGGETVTIKDFMFDYGFECEPLGDDVLGYWFAFEDIDEVVYCKNDHTEPSVTPKKKRNNTIYYEEHDKLIQLRDVLYKEREHLIKCTEPNCDEYTETQKAYMKSEICVLKSLIHLISLRMIDLKEAADD